MPHLDQDDLIMLAFGQQPGDGPAAEHLDSCPQCRSEFATLRELAEVGREASELHDLSPPPSRVWDAIAAQVQPAARPIVQKAPWLKPALVGALAAVVAAVATWLAVRPSAPPPPLASASLTAFGSTSAQAGGTALLRSGGSLAIAVSNLPAAGAGYYEVWLIDPDTLDMFSVGVLGEDPETTFALPPNVDLHRYRLVDVSVEQFDNRPTHSGNTLVRGELSPLE